MKKIFIIGILIGLFIFSTYVCADSSVTSTGISDASLKERLENAVALCIGSNKALVNNSFTQVDSTNPGVGPIVKNSRTLVPVRFISERFGADVKWDDSTSTATITTQDRVAKITTESSKMIVNGDEIVLDVPAEKIQNRLFIPLRRLVEDVLNKKVFYESGLIVISDNENIMDKNSEAESISGLIKSFEPNPSGISTPVEDGVLLPASVVTLDGPKWGYIDDHAQFKIKPEYDGVEEFNKAGIAVAFNYTGKEKNSYGDKDIYVIDKSGKKLIGPQKAKEYLTTDQNIIIIGNDKSKFINKSGTVFLETEKRIFDYSEGLLRFSDGASSYYCGFMDEGGTVVIPVQFSYAEGFKDGKARVTVKSGDDKESCFIDTKGNRIVSQDDLIPFMDKATHKYGYKDINGNIIIEPQYETTEEFENGYAAVEVSNSEQIKKKIGLIDKKGDYIIKPEYTGIHSIGEGLFTVNKRAYQPNDSYVPSAIFNDQGQQLSDFKYFNVQNFEGNYASACDNTTTFFIDKSGEIVNTLPMVTGIGTMKIKNGIIYADADGVKSYYKKNGELIWMQDNSILLQDEIKVRKIVYRPDYSTHIEYPEFENLPDREVQEKINNKLKSIFVSGVEESEKQYKITDLENEEVDYPFELDNGFSAVKNNDLVIIEESGYLYTGGAHGMPSLNYYHINFRTGDFYELSDLFKKDSKFDNALTSIIQKQIATVKRMNLKEAEMYSDPDSIEVRKDQPFEITDDCLKIYYQPYEIAAYAAGFPEFKIPYGQLLDIIDTESPLWKSFNMRIKDVVTVYDDSESDEAGDSINELLLSYEKNMIEAINSNDFKKVEANLLMGSSLYNDQKKLIGSLNKQGIKEKFNSADIYAIAYDYDTKEYKVFVYENIAIKYSGKEFADKKFTWCYTVKEVNGEYKLSKIDKWQP